MRVGIHPAHEPARVTCGSCGNVLETRWSAGDTTVETCSNCHPAYTGRAARASSGSRSERFERRRERAGPTRV
jgi:large subunit ribosomal protein L31